MTFAGQTIIFSWLAVIYDLWLGMNTVRHIDSRVEFLRSLFEPGATSSDWEYAVGYFSAYPLFTLICLACGYAVYRRASVRHGWAMMVTVMAAFVFVHAYLALAFVLSA